MQPREDQYNWGYFHTHSWGSKIAIILFLADVHIQAYGSTAGLLEPSWVARNLKCFGIRDLDDR